MKQNIFFIVGTGRCGTQMLRNVLNNWNEIVILPETHFIINLYNKYQLKKIEVHQFLEVVENTYGSNGEKWIKVILNTTNKKYNSYKAGFTNYVNNENLKGNIGLFILAFFEYLYGKNFTFGDKTPYYGANLDIILKIFPNAKIINLKRDGINTALSMSKHPAFIKYINGKIKFKDIGKYKLQNKEKYLSNKSPSIEESILFWKNSINQIDKSIEKTKKINSFRLLNLRYEDLVYDTKKTIRKIIFFLKLRNNNFFLFKTICKIRPFASYKKPSVISDDQYFKLYNIAKFEMQKHKYPYLIKNKNSIFFELIRSIAYYFLKIFEITNRILLKIFNDLIN